MLQAQLNGFDLMDGMLRLSIAQGMIFGLIDGAEENMKIIV